MFFGRSKSTKPTPASDQKENSRSGAGGKSEPAKPSTPAAASTRLNPAEPSAQKSKDSGSTSRALNRSRRQALALGQIVTVFMKTKSTSQMNLSQLRSLVRPALASGQFVIAEAAAREGDAVSPVAVVLWARVSGEVDAQLAAGGSLADGDWSSGDIPWLVLAAGRKIAIKRIVDDLQKRQLGGKSLKVRKAPVAVAER